MGNDVSLCNVSRQMDGDTETSKKAAATPQSFQQSNQQAPMKANARTRISASDNFLPCDCCAATPRGRAGQDTSSRRGFEEQIQTPRSKAQAFRNVDAKQEPPWQERVPPKPAEHVPELFVTKATQRGSSIPPLDYSLDSGSVPPSTDVDGRWIGQDSNATSKDYLYDPV